MTGEGLSLRAYARHRGCALNAVQAAIKSGRLRNALLSNGRIADAAAADAEWAATTKSDRRPLTGPTANGATPPDYAESRARREAAEAELAEIEVAKAKRQLVPAADVEARLVKAISACKTKLLGIPSRARQQDPNLDPAQIALVEELIREALDALAEGGE